MNRPDPKPPTYPVETFRAIAAEFGNDIAVEVMYAGGNRDNAVAMARQRGTKTAPAAARPTGPRTLERPARGVCTMDRRPPPPILPRTNPTPNRNPSK